MIFLLIVISIFCIANAAEYLPITYSEMIELRLPGKDLISIGSSEWKLSTLDKLEYAQKNYDDSQWSTVSVNAPLQKTKKSKIVWYRTQFELSSSTSSNNLELSLGTISLGDEVYLNGFKCGSYGFDTTVNGSSWRHRNYQLMAPKKWVVAGKNTLAIRVKVGSRRGMYQGIPKLRVLKENYVFGKLAHRSSGISATFRHICSNPEINDFSFGEKIFIRPQLSVCSSQGDLSGIINLLITDKAGKKIQQTSVPATLKSGFWHIVSPFEIHQFQIGEYNAKIDFSVNNESLWKQDIGFTISKKSQFSIPVDNNLAKLNSKTLPISLGDVSFGTFGPRHVNKKNQLWDDYSLNDSRAGMSFSVGYNPKYLGPVILHSNVKAMPGNWKYSNFISSIGGYYDGMVDGWSAGIIRPETGKLIQISTNSTNWTGKSIRFNYDNNNALDFSWSQLSPAWQIQGNFNKIRVFENHKRWKIGGATCLYTLQQGKLIENKKITNFSQNWILVSFSGAKNWDEFDIPYLLVFEKRPLKAVVCGNGIILEFAKDTGIIQGMPLFGVTLQPINLLSVNAIKTCQFWSQALLAMPNKISRSIKLDYKNDRLLIRDEFQRKIINDDWNTPALKIAPIPPTLILASTGGLPLSISNAITDLNYATLSGPLTAVKDADSYVFCLEKSTHYVTEIRKNILAKETPKIKKYRTKLSSLIENKILPTLQQHPWKHLTVHPKGKATIGSLEPNITNLMLSLPHINHILREKVKTTIISEAPHSFVNDQLLVKIGKKGDRKPINTHVTNPLSGKTMSAITRHVKDNGIDCPCYEAMRLYLLWNYAQTFNQWNFIKSNWSSIERYFNLVVNSHDWAYSICWDSYAGIRVGNGLQESSIFHAAFAAYARMAHKLGFYELRDKAAYYSLIHLVGMKTCTSETTMKYLRQARPWLLSHSLAHDIEFLEQTHPGHFLEFNERGGFFHWIIRPRNHIFGPQFIMTQLPEVMRPFREVWGEYTNKHYRGVLNGELFAKTMPPPVDTFVYMTSKPPYSAEELFKIRNNANIDHWSLLADLRAMLDSTGIITYQRIW